MFIILHGTNYSKSKTLASDILSKKNIKHFYKFHISEISEKKLEVLTKSVDIFHGYSNFIIDFSKYRPKISKFLEILKNTHEETICILITDTELTNKSELIKFSKEVKAKVFLNNKKIESNSFNFVDALIEKNKTKAYRELSLLNNRSEDVFKVFGLIIYSYSNLLYVLTSSKLQENINPYVLNKIKRQAKNYTETEVKKIINFLYEIDLMLKSGKISQENFLVYLIEMMIE